MAATGYNVLTTSDTISFRDGTTGLASISFDHATETLSLTQEGTGAISFGDTASDLYIGDGVNSVDLIFEVDGAVKGDTDVTLTLGATDSDILIASPIATLTGSQLATESWVLSQVVDSAPSTLNTLNELAAALGDDANYSTTISTALGNRLRVDTASQGLNGTQQSNGRTNLGLGTAATFASTAFATAAQGTSADTAYNWGNHASAGYATAGDENIIDGATSIWNADGDGDVFAYDDSNPTHNGKYVGAIIDIRGDGASTSSLVRAGIFTSNHVSTTDGYYVGTILGYTNSTTTQVINSSGAWVGSAIGDSKISSASNWNTAYGWGNHASAGYLTGNQTITLSGDVSGSGTTSINVTVANDSHTHDGRYYTESEVNTLMARGYANGQAQDATGLTNGAWYTIAQNTGDRAVARFGLRDSSSGDHQSVIFYAAHNYGTDASNTITVLHNSYYSGSPFRYIRIKDNGTYDGAVLQVYVDSSHGAGDTISVYLLGDNFQGSGWVLVDWLADATAPSGVSNYSSFTEKSKIDLDQIAQGGIATTGPIYGDGDTTQHRMFNDNYHPNADKLTTARNIALTGAVTGNTNFDGSGNISIATTATADPTLTLAGDASGSATFTNLGNATLTVTVADDSHNHIISNVDGLQTALDAKQAAGTYNTIIGTDTDISYSGATVLSAMTMTDGVIQSHSSRTLTLADLGYTGATNANNYSLPLAASGTRGGVQIGYAENGKNYPVELSSEKMFVNVPWTDNNTTYTAGRGLDLSGTEFQLETDLRDSVSLIGLDSNDYVQWSNNSYFRSVVNGTERFRVNTAGIDVTGTATANAFRSDTSSTDYSIITRNTAATNYVMYVQANQSGSTQSIASFRYGSAVANQGSEVLAIRRDSSYFSNTKLGIGTTNPSTALHVEGTVTHKVYTASTLPSASPEGQRSFISDSAYGLATAIGSVVSGGGSNTIPVYSDGFSWRAG